ncbi:MFS transporter, partial [Staphylococcus arlettae]|uniref:MFS transporter n=1 Tax=Staphylococcus arlettae TaxID=29378 RepID=UPI00115D2C15
MVAILFWLPQLKVKVKAALQRDEPHAYPIIKSKLAWAVALLMAFQSMSFYCIVAWYPSILISKGISPETAGYMLMLNQFAQLPMTFTFPIIAAKMKNQRRLIQMITLLFLIGFSLLWSQHVMLLILAMIFYGLAIGECFSLC